MPSLQGSLPPELADNVIRLYRECLRRARYIGQKVPYIFFSFYYCMVICTSTVDVTTTVRFGLGILEPLDLPFMFTGTKTVAMMPLITRFDAYQTPAYVCLWLLVNMVRQQFKMHKNETDPEKIQKLKDEYVPTLCYIFFCIFWHM
ncbi:uncharacterized protein LOC144574645 [Carex rostrata]